MAKVMKSKLAKAAVVGGVGLGMVGLGAGAASAQPGPDLHGNQPQQNQPHWDRHQNNPGPNHPNGHGFWFFDRWVPLPW
ncbi:hypothetical protein [Nocardia testacea]|uniref:hypothetical protein n=1 Tax=Nocardia testacea TaxID=248551 RepID=UPI003A8B7A24